MKGQVRRVAALGDEEGLRLGAAAVGGSMLWADGHVGVLAPGPWNVTLFEERVFTEIIKLR